MRFSPSPVGPSGIVIGQYLNIDDYTILFMDNRNNLKAFRYGESPNRGNCQIAEMQSVKSEATDREASRPIMQITSREMKMSAPEGLVKIAREIAATLTAKNEHLRLKRDELEKQLAEIERELASTVDANSRAV